MLNHAELHPRTRLWITLDPASEHVRTHTEEIIDGLIDLGVEQVGFHGIPDALGVPGWEATLQRFLDTGFQCLLNTAFPLPISPRQAELLARLEEIWVPSGTKEGMSSQQILAMAEAHGVHPPRIVETDSQAPSHLPRPTGCTRDCLDPWEGLVLGPAGEGYPCAIDSVPVGNQQGGDLQSLLESPGLRRRRWELLTGVLASPCLTCPRSAWIPRERFQEKVSKVCQRSPKPIPLPTSQELQDLFGTWASEGRRVLLYPAGNHARWLIQYAPAVLQALVGFGDRNPSKQGAEIFGKPVLAPDQITPSSVDIVLIAAGPSEAEIQQSLEPLKQGGIQIIPMSRLGRLWRRLKPSRNLSMQRSF